MLRRFVPLAMCLLIAASPVFASNDPTKDPEADYNAGVQLMNQGRDGEAIARFEAATAAEPAFTNAFYNLGQARYNRKEFAKALVAWTRALELEPEDFEAAKKIVQARHGMGDLAGAARAREQAIAIWKRSTDPDVRKLQKFVFDQFEASGWKVYASEVFERPEDLGYLYLFQVADAKDQVVGTVRLEPRIGSERSGIAYIIGIEKGSVLFSPGPGFKVLPGYDELKPIVIAAIAREFPSKP